MKFYVIDAETYWADDYTLSKMTPEAYIRDGRFLAQGWGVVEMDSPNSWWFTDYEFREWAKYAYLEDAVVICHNTRFDGAILSWRYGIRPKLWVDTMGMFRALEPWHRSYSLAKLAVEHGLGAKGDFINFTKNKRVLTPDEHRLLGEYCLQDCALTARLFNIGWPQFPVFERLLMDVTLRMFTEPLLHVDTDLLGIALIEVRESKQKLLDDCGLTKKDLMSGGKFAAALSALGVQPPVKQSPSDSSKSIYAFAKTDAAFTALQEDDDPKVQTLVAARLGNKSTLMETRIERLIDIGNRGTLPVPLNYWGAKVSGRHSGGDKINMTNLIRGSVLRHGVVAPPGMLIVVGDSSNIELRVVMAAAGQKDQIERIRYYDSIPEAERVTDLYCDFASAIYGRTVTKSMPNDRFVGKEGKLSLQYGASALRFQEMLRRKNYTMEIDEATRVVRLYRREHRRITNLWQYCGDTVLPAIAAKEAMVPVDVNGWVLTNGTGFSIPGELGVTYKNLICGQQGFSYDNGTAGGAGIYSSKVAENLCQYLARMVVMYQMLLVQTRYRVVHSVYDEIVCCVPENEAEECAAFVLQCLATAPPWTQGKLPVTGEVGFAKTYGAAK